MSYYNELLKKPQWQKKRLEVLQRDNWSCTSCQIKTENLQVHHLIYEKGKKPWEYADHNLITLCESCHQKEHGLEKNDPLSLIQEHILNLQSFLKGPITWEREQSILRQIVSLQKRRKDFVHG